MAQELKAALLVTLLKRGDLTSVLVFTRTKIGAARLAISPKALMLIRANTIASAAGGHACAPPKRTALTHASSAY